MPSRKSKPPKRKQQGPLSELQATWESLREMVEDASPFPKSDRLLALIDRATSWESVRDLGRMRTALSLVRELAAEGDVPEDVRDWLQDVVQSFEDLDAAIAEGQKI